MSAKDKAKQLYELIRYDVSILKGTEALINEVAKKCALIAVDEMLDFRNGLYINEGSLAHKYLLDIKHEIEKL